MLLSVLETLFYAWMYSILRQVLSVETVNVRHSRRVSENTLVEMGCNWWFEMNGRHAQISIARVAMSSPKNTAKAM